MKKIVLTGGGTLGHVTPNLALLPHLKKSFDEIHYIGSVGGMEERVIKQTAGDVIYHNINCTKLRRSLTLKNLAVPFKLFSSIREAKNLLNEINPTVIFSKGGFVSLPVCLAAKGRFPVVLHESDYTMGLANKLSKGSCDKILTSFRTSIKDSVWTGAPLREELYHGNREKTLLSLNFKRSLPCLLITGGSQGAKAINEVVTSSLTKLLERFNIVHLTGKNFKNTIKRDGYIAMEFSLDMPSLYSACDFVLCRGGANTLFELTALSKPALVVPLPAKNSRGDQVDNARYFEALGVSKTLLQEDLTSEKLVRSLEFLVKNEAIMKQNARLAKKIDGTLEIAEILSNYAQ
jgi:UDP-N-acetylglucosamine--N-acetylmuramyl-(pentapeptide) pyrophosphoryl-undecaprenol N-acetylglucosamine transferase